MQKLSQQAYIQGSAKGCLGKDQKRGRDKKMEHEFVFPKFAEVLLRQIKKYNQKFGIERIPHERAKNLTKKESNKNLTRDI